MYICKSRYTTGITTKIGAKAILTMMCSRTCWKFEHRCFDGKDSCLRSSIRILCRQVKYSFRNSFCICRCLSNYDWIYMSIHTHLTCSPGMLWCLVCCHVVIVFIFYNVEWPCPLFWRQCVGRGGQYGQCIFDQNMCITFSSSGLYGCHFKHVVFQSWVLEFGHWRNKRQKMIEICYRGVFNGWITLMSWNKCKGAFSL